MTSDMNDDIEELENMEGLDDLEGDASAPPSGGAGPEDAAEAALAAPRRSALSGGGGKKTMLLVGLLALVLLGGGGAWFFLMGDDTPAVPPPVAAATPPAQAAPAPTSLAAANPPGSAPATDPLAPKPDAFASPATPPANGIAPPTPVTNTATAPAASPAATPATPADAAATGPGTPAPDALGPPPDEEAAAMPAETGPNGATASAPATPAPAATPAGTAAATPGQEPAPIEMSNDEPPADLPTPAMMGGDAAQQAAAPAAAANPAAAAATPAPAATPAAAAAAPANGKPSPAEMAIVQNAAVLDQLSPPVSPAGTQAARPFDPNQPAPSQSTALSAVDQMLEEAAVVRPLPPAWLTVKKVANPEDVDTRITSARMALAQNNDRAALQMFSELQGSYPKDKRIMMGKAIALQRLGQDDAALVAYEKVLRNDPKNLEALTNMLGLLNTKDPKLAIEKLKELRETYPFQADITAQLGVSYGAAGRYSDALHYLDMAEALKPGDISILYNKAVVYDRMGNARQAGDLYRQVILMASEGDAGQNIPLDSIRRRLAVLR